MKWENHLLGHSFTVITDHKALEFFKMKDHQNMRQARWQSYLSCFCTNIKYVKGNQNKVGDCLSRYYTSDDHDKTVPYEDFVSADIWLDQEGDDLPEARMTKASQMME